MLSKYAQKLVNSGHSQLSSKIFIVQGVAKYFHKLKLSRLPKQHPQYKPLHLAKEYQEEQRQTDKYLARMNWFKPGKTIDNDLYEAKDWRDALKGVWKGSNTSQRRVKDMKFSSIMQVPNTRDARLLNTLVRIEPEVAKVTGYNVKMVERSGIALSRLFQRVPTRTKCHWESCPVCAVKDTTVKSCLLYTSPSPRDS